MTSAPTSDAPTVTITAGELSGAHIDMEVRVSLPDGGVLSGQLVGVGHTSDHSLAVGQPRRRRATDRRAHVEMLSGAKVSVRAGAPVEVSARHAA
jgi:hypothetical protein